MLCFLIKLLKVTSLARKDTPCVHSSWWKRSFQHFRGDAKTLGWPGDHSVGLSGRLFLHPLCPPRSICVVSGFTLHVTTESLATCVFINRPSFFQALTCFWGNKVQVTQRLLTVLGKVSDRRRHLRSLIMTIWLRRLRTSAQWAGAIIPRPGFSGLIANHEPPGISSSRQAVPPRWWCSTASSGIAHSDRPSEGFWAEQGWGDRAQRAGRQRPELLRDLAALAHGAEGRLCFLITEAMGLLQGGQWASFTSNQAALWDTHTSTEIASWLQGRIISAHSRRAHHLGMMWFPV